ncbi:DNA-ligase (ATP) [Rhodococcus opacus M213]|uniref:DNA-ligase (ATP) n=1 Tax=Rhodococcus opacus M213 TaxID=1129896 RepID=K8XLP1_RHOOP|nr:DNA ligase (ATP) [Rhodococcus opacus]EKT77965.1 DNA-ligase (ATP) [Rhodococcus opacus M213]
MFSRNGNDITATFPELAGPISEALGGREAIIDGEIVALDANGRPSFSRLQRRMQVLSPTTQLRNEAPVTYYVFDVLALDGKSTTGLPYLRRRTELDDLALSGPRLQVPPYWTDVDGEQMLDLARRHHLEGAVAKRVDSRAVTGLPARGNGGGMAAQPGRRARHPADRRRVSPAGGGDRGDGRTAVA